MLHSSQLCTVYSVQTQLYVYTTSRVVVHHLFAFMSYNFYCTFVRLLFVLLRVSYRIAQSKLCVIISVNCECKEMHHRIEQIVFAGFFFFAFSTHFP